MSVAQCREINARLRAAGVVVREYPGWTDRGNGQTSAYEGGIVHHTATGFGIAAPGTGVYDLLVKGRPDLKGPLCNYAGNEDGSITVIAAHPANHAGASGGRSMGPLPTTASFNRRVLGLEIVYPGTQPMRDAQYRTSLVWANAVAAVCGRGDIQRVRAHAETSITGKWDPGDAPNRTINMVAFRAAARILEEDDMTPEDLLNYRIPRYGSSLGGETTLKAVLANWDRALEREAARDAALTTMVTALSRNPDVDPAALKVMVNEAVKANTPTAAQIAAASKPAIAEAVRDAVGADNEDLAEEIVRRLGNKLSEGN